jgi:sarcosine oxidase subunit alpha
MGWPSTERDVFSVFWWLRRFLPVGFYYKTFIHPRALWPIMDRVIRRVAGLGHVPRDAHHTPRQTVHHHPDVLVVGGGVAGLAAALAAAEAGRSVILADEYGLGEKVAPGPVRDRIASLHAVLRSKPNVTILERAAAIAVYEGPLVPVDAADFLHQIHPKRIVVATGAVERHAVFSGSDLPGVWLGRGAARMAGVHSISIGRQVVFSGETAESVEHLRTLLAHGTGIAAVLVPQHLVASLPKDVRVIAGGTIVAARGRRYVGSVVVESGAQRETIACDGVVVSLGLEARNSLFRQAPPGMVVAAGDAARAGMSLAQAEESGRNAVSSGAPADIAAPLPAPCTAGFVCLCEDVTVKDLQDAWAEGYQSTEILKRYTTVSMGPCQGALCQAHLRAFAAEKGGRGWVTGATTARPPIRAIRLEDAAAGLYHVTEQRTALHERHVAAGARMELVGPWLRPQTYGDTADEYWAVRRAVSIMDVSTLGKYYLTGRDAIEFLERLYPCHVRDIAEGRLRYALLLNEAGHVLDDGLIGSLGSAGFYLTFTSSGADGVESWLRDWIETWKLKVHIVNQTTSLGAINLAGPRARELLQRLTSDAVDGQSFPYSRHRELTVAGVKCRALRVGFVGELSIELHHNRSESVKLWDALVAAGADLGIKPHGMDALRLLRLEKGHILVGQDTDFDTTPAKLGLDWAVKMEKPYFVGKTALERIARATMAQRLVPILFDQGPAPAEGAALSVGEHNVGYLTSARYSPTLERGVGLGWVRRVGDQFPAAVRADGIPGTVVSHAFYDPKGEKLRA